MIYPEFVPIREWPAWKLLGLHRINDSWGRWIRSPFEMSNFFEYFICPPNLNPCAEIPIGKREVCNIQIGRKIESPFSLTNFTELYEIGPWEAEHPMMAFVMEPQWNLAA